MSNIVSERKLMASSSMNLFVIGAINSQDLNICTVNHSSIQTFCSFTLYLRYGFWRWLMSSLWFLNVIKKGFDPNIIYSLQIKFKSYLKVFFKHALGNFRINFILICGHRKYIVHFLYGWLFFINESLIWL